MEKSQRIMGFCRYEKQTSTKKKTVRYTALYGHPKKETVFEICAFAIDPSDDCPPAPRPPTHRMTEPSKQSERGGALPVRRAPAPWCRGRRRRGRPQPLAAKGMPRLGRCPGPRDRSSGSRGERRRRQSDGDPFI